MAVPYVKPVYDNSAHRNRMADLARIRDARTAETIRAEGERSAQLASNLGQIAGSTMAELGRIRRDAPLERARNAQAARYEREVKKADELDMLNSLTSEYSPEDKAKVLESQGFADEGSRVRSLNLKQQSDMLELERLRNERNSMGVRQAIQEARAIRVAPDDQKQAAWTAWRDKVTPDLSKYLPEQPPTDDETWDRIFEFGMTTKEILDVQADAARRLNESRKTERDVADYIAKNLSVVQDQAGFDRVRALAKQQGAESMFTATFGDTFTPEVAAQARKLSGQKDTAPTYGSAEWAKTATPEEQAAYLRWKAQESAAGRAPDKPEKPDAATRAQVGQAERWKQDELSKIEDAMADPEQKGQWTPERIEQEKLRIQNAYLAQLGLPGVSSLGPEWSGGRTPMAALAKPKPKASAPAAVPSRTPEPSTMTDVQRRQMAESLMSRIREAQAMGEPTETLIAQLTALKTRR